MIVVVIRYRCRDRDRDRKDRSRSRQTITITITIGGIMEFRIANTFQDSLLRLTAQEQEGVQICCMQPARERGIIC